MADSDVILMAVGDIILDMPRAETYFAPSLPVLRTADVLAGHAEVMFTDRGVCSTTDAVAPPCDPANFKALPYAGFNVITLAGNHQDSRQWTRRRKELFGFEPDPEYPTYPFHPEAKQTIIVKLTIRDGKISRVSYLPCLVNKYGQPEILKNDESGQRVFDYMEKITREAGLNARYEWYRDEVVIN